MPARREASIKSLRVASRASSVSLAAVTSSVMPKVPMIRPASSRSGSLQVRTHVTRPSDQTTFPTLSRIGVPVSITSSSSCRASFA